MGFNSSRFLFYQRSLFPGYIIKQGIKFQQNEKNFKTHFKTTTNKNIKVSYIYERLDMDGIFHSYIVIQM